MTSECRETHRVMVRDAYQRGLRDFAAGMERFENPFGATSHPEKRKAWQRGWDAADTKNRSHCADCGTPLRLTSTPVRHPVCQPCGNRIWHGGHA